MSTRRRPVAESASSTKADAGRARVPASKPVKAPSKTANARGMKQPEHDEQFEMRSRRVFEAMRELRRLSFRHLYEELYGEGDEALEPAQYDALELLLTESEWRMSDYAHALRVDPSTATRMVDRLVKAGVATRGPSGADGRGIVVRGTRAGRLRRLRVEEGRREFMRDFLRVFSDNDLDALIELMERLADSVAVVAYERAASAVAKTPRPRPTTN
jgi:DNA-binding MarR family transcriptional regulator